MDRRHPRPIPPALVVIHDVAASWASYPSCGLALTDGPVAGLILHAAGPTHEGFRTVDVWESDQAYRRHHDGRGDRWPPGLAIPPVVRTLDAVRLIFDTRA